MKRNPKWHRDEILLALHLYLSPDRGSIDKKNPKVIALSKLLNDLPIISNRPDQEKFRNANGVALKLSNFLPFDKKNYHGKGMTRGSKLDKEIFEEYFEKRDQLNNIVKEIINITNSEEIKEEILHIEEDEQTLEDSVEEGTILYKLHKFRERSPQIVKRKKEDILEKKGRLLCEVCGFDFHSSYGDLGKGFIECHHRVPLSNIKTSRRTSLNDLALVCSNCHRMLHKNMAKTSIERLKEIVNSL